MDPTAVPTSQRRIRRRWRVPPAIMHGSESLESAAVLEEVAGHFGLALWQALRDVTLWAATPPAEREELFSSGAERNRIATLLTLDLDPQVEQPLGMLTSLVGRPGKVSAERVALACRQLAQWAEAQGKLGTALAFAQAGAVSCPGDAAAAFKVGQIARRRAEYVRAETWFRRAIALARQEADWATYSLAFVGLGNLYVQRGNLPVARRFHVRGLRSARRHSLREVQGRALHDLHVIATTTGDVEEALVFAREACAAYGEGHRQLPKLAHDVAYFWLTQGNFRPALSVFQALRSCLDMTRYWVYLLPNTIRAAGGAGDRKIFEPIWQELWRKIDATEPTQAHAEAMLDAARGAASLCEWERAQQATERALALAEQRKEGRVVIQAESLLQAIATEQRAGEAMRAELGSEKESLQFAEELVQGLALCTA